MHSLANIASDLRIPVCVYVFMLLTMCAQASVWFKEQRNKKVLMHFWARLFLCFSDTVLAYDRFYITIPHALSIVLISYYTALYFIARSVHSK